MFGRIAWALLCAFGLAWSPAAADQIRIDNPVVDGVPVDWCWNWGQGCGWLGAHAFCRDRGYERALRFETFAPGRTYMMNGDSFCTGPTCTAFLSVTCKMSAGQAEAEPPPPQAAAPPVRPARVRFDHPRNGRAPADWCSLSGLDCGWGGANKFCATRGFERAVDFSTYRPGATAVAGADSRCHGPHCVGLRHVVCEQAAAAPPASAAPPEYAPAAPPGDPPPYVED